MILRRNQEQNHLVKLFLSEIIFDIKEICYRG